MALNYKRGSASITDAATRKSGGNFRPFLPQIAWREDGDSKYVLVLTDIEEVAELLLHSFIPVGKAKKANGDEFVKYEDFLSRKDGALGEDYDDLEDRLEREPKRRHMGVMVELEPVFEAGTSKKLKHFVVKTETFVRKSDDGDIDVTAPIIGLCVQSAQLMWGPLNNLYHQLGDLVDIPLSITRHGAKTNTRYDAIPFMEKPVDLTPLIDYVDGINYIGDDLPELILAIEAADSDVAKAQVIADFLLTKRINELADAERYEDLVSTLTLEDMPTNAWGRKAPAKTPAPRRSAPRRVTPEAVAEPPQEPAAAEDAPARVDRFAALKSRVESRA